MQKISLAVQVFISYISRSYHIFSFICNILFLDGKPEKQAWKDPHINIITRHIFMQLAKFPSQRRPLIRIVKMSNASPCISCLSQNSLTRLQAKIADNFIPENKNGDTNNGVGNFWTLSEESEFLDKMKGKRA